MKKLLLYSCIFVLILKINPSRGVTFYPHGNETTDLTLPRRDDAFSTIQLSFDFPFFGEIYREIHVSTNGIIFFGQGSTQYTPSPFPLNGMKCVAAYWVDSDPRFGGDIFYREVFDTNLLTSISNEIRSKFINRDSFRASWAFIVTFDNVPRFGCSGSSEYPCSNVVKHQTILASNGIESFVLFLYKTLKYSRAQIGFNAGDGKRYFMVPYSNTVNSTTYPLRESNVGEPGKWMFGITSDITSACDSSGLLEVYPKKVLYYGGQEILITGPCFTSNHSTVTVTFGKQMINCQVNENLKINCIAPYLDTLGRIPLSFEHGSMNYTSFILTHDESDEIVKSTAVELAIDDVDSPFIITWNRYTNVQSNDNVLLSGMQEDIVIDSSGNVLQSNRLQISSMIPNTGSYEYRPNQSHINRNTIIKISLFVGAKVSKKIIKYAVSYSCDDWITMQPGAQEINQIKDRESRRNPCQPTVPWNFPVSLPGNFEMDESCHPLGNNWCPIFHPGAKGCYRSTNNLNKIAVQCCYNEANQLLIGPPGGGTLDMHDSKDSPFWHFIKDVLPYFLCCKWQSKCDQYYEKRPSINSTYFVRPVVRRANGDPHFVTMDGSEYDFNPVGEFTFLKAPDLLVQTRISQYTQNGVQKPASYFSAFAVKLFQSEVISIELSVVKKIQVLIGSDNLYPGVWSFESFTINNSDSSFVSLETSQGFKLEVEASNGMLHAIVMLGQSFKRNVFGLIGNWDDNPDNDFMLPNGTFIAKNSSNQDIHFLFGMQWATTENNSIFSYPTGLSWKDFQNPTFTPFFGVPSSDSRCNGNRECLFDLHVTGDINVALSNVKMKEKVAEAQKMYNEISESCMLNINISNGLVNLIYNLTDLTYVQYKIICNKNYQLSGTNGIVICSKGNYSTEFGTCQKSLEVTSIGSTFRLEIFFLFPLLWSMLKYLCDNF